MNVWLLLRNSIVLGLCFLSMASSASLPSSDTEENPYENTGFTIISSGANGLGSTDSDYTVYQIVFERIRRLPIVEQEDSDRPRRTFPEVDSRGFDEDVFDEGFGEWYPMKRF
ncbi:hypothetical protein X975_12579, partial [Stegodyphus mimosarum]